MQIDIPLTDLAYTDLNAVIAGRHICPPKHLFGPAVRNYYLIHFITKGKGIFTSKGKEYILGENQGFLICPNEVTYYEADSKDPWNYIWIGFRGLKSLELLEQVGLGQNQPIFYSEECKEIFDLVEKGVDIACGKELYFLSLLYSFFSLLSKKITSTPKSYAARAAGYISANISNDLKVTNISKMLVLDRRYFCQVFKQEYGISPQQYIINKRIESAKSLIGNTSLSIGDISRSVGYKDQLAFSKLFKKCVGFSPVQYRKMSVKQ